MSKNQKETSGLAQKYSRSTRRWPGSARLPSDYSPPTQPVWGVKERSLSQFQSDYQLTVRPKVDLSRYQMSMLLEIKCFEVVEFGIDFVSWLTIEYLFSRLLGSRKVWDIREKSERRVLTLSNMILLSTQNSWMNLGEREDLNKDLLAYLKDSTLLPSEREVNSRIAYWQPEKFLEVRSVRLDVFLEREMKSIRYSSYCKGYGESSSMGRRQKTKPSFELDGEEIEKPEVVILSELQDLLFLNLLEIKRKLRSGKA